VLFIHHAGKGGKQLGTSKREDVLDTVIALKRPSDYVPEQGSCFEVHFEKSRTFYGSDAEPVIVTLKDDDTGSQCWSIQSLEKNTHDKVIELMSEGLKQGDIAVELGVNKSNVSRHVKRAKAEGLLP
jgi:putative DNA primase/helicase